MARARSAITEWVLLPPDQIAIINFESHFVQAATCLWRGCTNER